MIIIVLSGSRRYLLTVWYDFRLRFTIIHDCVLHVWPPHATTPKEAVQSLQRVGFVRPLGVNSRRMRQCVISDMEESTSIKTAERWTDRRKEIYRWESKKSYLKNRDATKVCLHEQFERWRQLKKEIKANAHSCSFRQLLQVNERDTSNKE